LNKGATTKQSFWRFASSGCDTNVELNALKEFEREFLEDLLEEVIRDYFVIGHKHAAECRIQQCREQLQDCIEVDRSVLGQN
jgi:hypothetical protein